MHLADATATLPFPRFPPMTTTPASQSVRERLARCTSEAQVPELVEALLAAFTQPGVSDLYVEPTAAAGLLRWRVDGVLHPLAEFPRALVPNVVARLKVLARLLTYEHALPQEGRLALPRGEARVSTFPTIFGERVVLRSLGDGSAGPRPLDELALPEPVERALARHATARQGLVLVTGPAGTGKTTTACAVLRQIVETSGGARSIVSLEDPVEIVVPGVCQSQVSEATGLTLAAGLKSLLRQDPEVIFLGEIRDRTTAEVTLQAALTGQLVVSTFHAGEAREAIARLVDMGLPAYSVRGAVRLVVAQRLLRVLCDCARPDTPQRVAERLGTPISTARVAVGCEQCRSTGYRGRRPVAECLEPSVADAPTTTLWQSALELVTAGVTSADEVLRVLGFAPATQPGTMQ